MINNSLQQTVLIIGLGVFLGITIHDLLELILASLFLLVLNILGISIEDDEDDNFKKGG